MTKTEKKRILKAMELLENKVWIFSCQALADSVNFQNKRLVKRYAKFYGQMSSYWDWTFDNETYPQYYGEHVKDRRLTALALFLVAEKDVK